MILKVLGVLQLVLVQIISAHLSTRDVSSQNIHKIPTETLSRQRRQINDITLNLPGNGNLPLNGLGNGLPFRNNIPFTNLPRGNNLPNNFAINNVMPNNFAWNNGMALPNNAPMNLPFLNRNILPQNRLLPNANSMINNGLFNNVPNVLPNINNPGTNLINNILNLNNSPTANKLPITNGLPNFNSGLCRNVLSDMALNSKMQNNLPIGNLLPPINSQLPLNNFQITGFKFANGLADITRLPRNNPPVDNFNSNANNLQNFNGISNNEMPQAVNGFSNINNGKTVIRNELPTFVSDGNGYQSTNNFMNGNAMPNNVPYNNGLPVASNNFQNNNIMAVNGQQFVANPLNNNFVIPNNFANNLPINAINNNGGFINSRQFTESGKEIYSQNGPGNNLAGNNLQYNNVDMPVNNWQYDFVNANVPGIQNSQSDGVATFSNLQNECQPTLTPNNFSLAQELVRNLQIEGIDNMPFLNGLPVAGITETVTVLNSPCS